MLLALQLASQLFQEWASQVSPIAVQTLVVPLPRPGRYWFLCVLLFLTIVGLRGVGGFTLIYNLISRRQHGDSANIIADSRCARTRNHTCICMCCFDSKKLGVVLLVLNAPDASRVAMRVNTNKLFCTVPAHATAQRINRHASL